MFKQVLAYFPLPFRLPGGFFPFRDPIREALLLCEPLFLWVCLGFGLWASSGPIPLSTHFGLYKRGRDPPQTLAVIWEKKWVFSLSSGCSQKVGEGVQPPSLPPPLPLCRRRDHHHSLPQPQGYDRCISFLESTVRIVHKSTPSALHPALTAYRHFPHLLPIVPIACALLNFTPSPTILNTHLPLFPRTPSFLESPDYPMTLRTLFHRPIILNTPPLGSSSLTRSVSPVAHRIHPRHIEFALPLSSPNSPRRPTSTTLRGDPLCLPPCRNQPFCPPTPFTPSISILWPILVLYPRQPLPRHLATQVRSPCMPKNVVSCIQCMISNFRRGSRGSHPTHHREFPPVTQSRLRWMSDSLTHHTIASYLVSNVRYPILDMDQEDLTLPIIGSFPRLPVVDFADQHACLHLGLG